MCQKILNPSNLRKGYESTPNKGGSGQWTMRVPFLGATEREDGRGDAQSFEPALGARMSLNQLGCFWLQKPKAWGR